jgi:arginine/ornithine N-succinyltransferase beta subunit
MNRLSAYVMFYDAGDTVKCHVDKKRVIAALQ